MPATTGNGAIAAAVGDFNGDGNIDLVTANQIDGTVSLLLGNGGGTFGAPFSINTGNVPYSVAVGDFNRDGLLDVAVVNSSDNNVAILLGDGTGKLRLLQKYSTGASSGPTSVITGDFNGDGILDLVTANSGSSKVAVLLGNGDGTFQAAVPYATGPGRSWPSQLTSTETANSTSPPLMNSVVEYLCCWATETALSPRIRTIRSLISRNRWSRGISMGTENSILPPLLIRPRMFSFCLAMGMEPFNPPFPLN